MIFIARPYLWWCFFINLEINAPYLFCWLYARLQTWRIMVWSCPSVRVSVRQFSTLFSNMLWHIELKVCIWLCFTVLQIKFKCRQFASSFVGVMPLLELRIKEIHSFPHFSLTCFDILSWNFLHMTLFYCTTDQVRVSSICVKFCGSEPLLELRILKIHSFPRFSLTCFDILSWNFAHDFILLKYRSS